MRVDSDTIFALATPVGRGALAVVRLSGSESFALAESLLSSKSLPPIGKLSRRLLYAPDTGELLDEAMVVRYKAPATYTGEDVVELHLHGAPVLVNLVLTLLVSSGGRPARPGEFTLRAFLNGKKDLTQAEAVHDLVAARSPAAVKQAATQLLGDVREHLDRLQEQLLKLVAELDAELDFPDDVDSMDSGELREVVARLEQDCRMLAASYSSGRLIKEGFRVALVGAPNAGKSSLFNALLGVERAIVTTEAGTTRDYLEEVLPVGSVALVLIDTAGVRQSASIAEQAGVDRTAAIACAADAVLFLVDSTRPWNDQDEMALQAVMDAALVPVLTKVDCPAGYGVFPSSLFGGGGASHQVSSHTGEGLHDLREGLVGMALEVLGGATEEVCLTSARQYDAMTQVTLRLAEVLDGMSHLPRDVIAIELRRALLHFHELTGEGHLDEGILDVIFSSFCIGK